MKITPDLLVAAVGCTPELAARYAPHLDSACAHFQISTPARLAAFLAQVGHESGSFRYAREIADGSAYEGRANLGNVMPGDGKRFRGRGLIQITGRDNYRQTTMRLQPLGAPNFVDHPEALEEPYWAAWSAADWWASRNLNALADGGEFDRITRVINGGTNGFENRRERWARALTVLPAAPVEPVNVLPEPVEIPAPIEHVDQAPFERAPTEWEMNNPPPPPPEKSMAPFVIPAVLELAKLIPRLGSMFGGSEVAQRNVAAAGVVVDAVVGAVGAANAQEAVEKIAADPAARETATKAVESVWYQISEAGGGGIDGARKADAATATRGDMLHSPSFWVACALLALVFWMMGNVMGLYGAEMDEKVRSAIINGAQGMILGGVVGYFFGQTTSRNRTPPA